MSVPQSTRDRAAVLMEFISAYPWPVHFSISLTNTPRTRARPDVRQLRRERNPTATWDLFFGPIPFAATDRVANQTVCTLRLGWGDSRGRCENPEDVMPVLFEILLVGLGGWVGLRMIRSGISAITAGELRPVDTPDARVYCLTMSEHEVRAL